MPLPAALVAAYSALAANASTAAFAGAAAVGLGIVATHTPEPEVKMLTGTPEVAAECVSRNVPALGRTYVAVVQPLQGTATMAVIVRSGVVGDPFANVVLQTAQGGSTVDFRPLDVPAQQGDVLARLIAGC
jgi:hypothetical protein